MPAPPPVNTSTSEVAERARHDVSLRAALPSALRAWHALVQRSPRTPVSVGGGAETPVFRHGEEHRLPAASLLRGVDLLTTGVDVLCLRDAAFLRYVQCPISFYVVCPHSSCWWRCCSTFCRLS